MKHDKATIAKILDLKSQGYSNRSIAGEVLGRESANSTISDIIKREKESPYTFEPPEEGAKILAIDIETAPLKAFVWSLWQDNVSLNMVESDWFILSYSAKWVGQPDESIMYKDLRGKVAQEDDSELLDDLWALLDDADIILSQNGKRFDTKKINTRLIMKGYKPPSSYKQIDTLLIAKAKFGFTSNKLEYLTDKLCLKHKKISHGKFPGFLLWKECLEDNIEAWEEMFLYNSIDVLSLEELYGVLAPWDSRHPNISHYNKDDTQICSCGSTEFEESGFHFTQVSKFQKYRCTKCGAEYRDRSNMFSKERKDKMFMRI